MRPWWTFGGVNATTSHPLWWVGERAGKQRQTGSGSASAAGAGRPRSTISDCDGCALHGTAIRRAGCGGGRVASAAEERRGVLLDGCR